MHKSLNYGCILLQQKDKQTDSTTTNFAKKFARHLPYTFDEILKGLEELISEDVLQLENDKLSQKRMVRDYEISLVRSIAGKKGAFAKQFASANVLANTENENEINKEGGVGETKTTRKERSKKYLPIAEYLSRIIRSNKNIKHSPQQLNHWAYSICQLVEIDGINLERIETALSWYEKNIGGEYVVEIESGTSLREKFIRLETATKRKTMSRNNNNPKIKYIDHIKCLWDETTQHYHHSVSGEIIFE